jgi:hypothetical protein
VYWWSTAVSSPGQNDRQGLCPRDPNAHLVRRWIHQSASTSTRHDSRTAVRYHSPHFGRASCRCAFSSGSASASIDLELSSKIVANPRSPVQQLSRRIAQLLCACWRRPGPRGTGGNYRVRSRCHANNRKATDSAGKQFPASHSSRNIVTRALVQRITRFEETNYQ